MRINFCVFYGQGKGLTTEKTCCMVVGHGDYLKDDEVVAKLTGSYSQP
ncbi:hypothetical protein [Arsenophonus apicola]